MTCRRFSAQEGKALGFINRVVPATQLESEAEQLAREIASKPSVPIAITKEHVNSVTRAMGPGYTAFADGDVLLATLPEEESRAAARTYRERTLGKKN